MNIYINSLLDWFCPEIKRLKIKPYHDLINRSGRKFCGQNASTGIKWINTRKCKNCIYSVRFFVKKYCLEKYSSVDFGSKKE